MQGDVIRGWLTGGIRSWVAGLAAALLTFVSLYASPDAQADHDTANGLNAGAFLPWGFNGLSALGETTEADITAAAAIQPTGLSTGRLNVQWGRVQAQNPVLLPPTERWSWGPYDAIYGWYQSKGVEPVLTLFDAPNWARSAEGLLCLSPQCAAPPATWHMSKWRDFVRRAVTRYPNVRAIEVWNEPNLSSFWVPGPNVSEYVNVFRAARAGVTDAGATAPVILGGLTPAHITPTPAGQISSVDFLRGVYQQLSPTEFDGVGTHPYPHTLPWANPYDWVAGMWFEVDRVQGVINEFGDEAPMWITETGIGTAGGPNYEVTEADQGPQLHQLYASLYGHDVQVGNQQAIKSFIIHRYRDAVPAPTNFTGAMGVVRHDRSPKPAYCYLGTEIGKVPVPPFC